MNIRPVGLFGGGVNPLPCHGHDPMSLCGPLDGVCGPIDGRPPGPRANSLDGAVAIAFTDCMFFLTGTLLLT